MKAIILKDVTGVHAVWVQNQISDKDAQELIEVAADFNQAIVVKEVTVATCVGEMIDEIMALNDMDAEEDEDDDNE